MEIKKILVLLISVIIMHGCSKKTINMHDVSGLKKSPKYHLKILGRHKYRLDYIASGVKYTYATYEIKSKHKYIEVLSSGKEVVAVSIITGYGSLYNPSITGCTLFPIKPKFNVIECLEKITEKIIARNNNNWWLDVVDVDVKEAQFQSEENFQTVGANVLLLPITAPTALLASPFLITDLVSNKRIQKKFNLSLGLNEDLDAFLQTVKAKQKSVSGKSGTVIINKGMLMRTPGIVFGYNNSQVIWVQKNPRWECSGGLFVWGMTCKIGRHGDNEY